MATNLAIFKLQKKCYTIRHTYASMMLSAGENSLWVATQMGHKDTEMIIKHYGRWIPDKSTVAGYQPINDWSQTLKVKIHL